MNAYSEDLRKKVVDAVAKRRMKKSEAAHAFGVSLSSVKRYMRLAVEGKPPVPKKRPGSLPKMDKTAKRLLEEDLKGRLAVSLRQRYEYLASVGGVAVSRSTLCRMIKRLGYTEKRSVGATERDEWLRAAWKTMVVKGLEARRLVFVDEWGTNTSLAPLYAYSPRGQRAYLKVPCNHGPNMTLLASMSTEGMGAS